jgi:hypothetical protein
VGRVGANSNARFCFQHHLPHSAGSSLAKSLLAEQLLWPYLGLENLEEADVKAWMCQHLEREIQCYFRGRLGPVSEG